MYPFRGGCKPPPCLQTLLGFTLLSSLYLPRAVLIASAAASEGTTVIKPQHQGK